MHMELGKAQACRPGALCGGGKWLMWLLIFLSLPEQRHKHTTAPFRQQYLSSYMTIRKRKPHSPGLYCTMVLQAV